MTYRMRGWARDTEPLAPLVEEAEPGFFEHRAMLALRALAAIYLAGIVLALFHEADTLSLLLVLTFNGAAFVLAMAYLVIARGLRHVHRWAVATARPLLVAIILEDVVVTVVAFGEGHLRPPVGAVIAGWALLGPAGVQPVPWPRAFSIAVLALTVPMLATLVLSRQLFDWGGAFDLQQGDISATVVASCGPAGGNPGTASGVPPESIHIRYDWSWQRGTPVPSGMDIVVIGWTGNDADGKPLYLLGPSEDATPGVYSGRRRYPSIDLANAVAEASSGSWQWGIELDEQHLAAGRIEANLERIREPSAGSQPLRILVSYVHVGQWHADTELTCEW